MASHVSQGMARPNACVTHGKPCVHMHANEHAYKMGGQFLEKGNKEEKEKEEKGKKERAREGEKMEKRKYVL